nr:odorant receptor [Semanotus bifasciatus]
MDRDHIYLSFTIKIFNILNMWPNEDRKCKFVKEFYTLVFITLSMLAALADFVVQFYDDDFSFTNLVESIIGASALCSVIYILICFMIKRREIERLTKHIKVFEDYLPTSKIKTAEETAKFYTKIFILYGMVGNIMYACLPLLSYADCNKNKSKHMIKYGIPCGVLARYVLPFKHDVYPLAQIIMVQQLVATLLGTIIVLTVTMLVCGILTHASANLDHLKIMILETSHIADSTITAHVNLCVKYHTAIIAFADQSNGAFSIMMLVHITWTSFIISVLGFEIVMDTNYFNSFRFTMHLGGWLGMLFLVCFYGQILMDKSTAIATSVYDTEWYKKSPSVRRSLVLILLRAQRPLVLRAAGLQIMSLAVFLGVLYTAYSYFTLLLKIKPT